MHLEMHLFLLLVLFSSGFSMKLENKAAPTFVLEQERSEDGSPTLSIIFPDGFQDRILLEKYEESEENDCHYIGQVSHQHF